MPIERELDFSQQDFFRIRRLMRDWVGISLNDSKEPLVYSRLVRRLRHHQLSRFTNYLDLVESDGAEKEQFINALTTNLTSFFREEHHFPILAKYLQDLPDKQPIRIWCAAASTGEEPYSIAMTAVEALGDAAFKRVTILASDLDTQVLAHGAQGIYRLEQIEKLGPERMKRFFLKGCHKQEGLARVKPQLQSLITFQQINLLAEKWPIDSPMDVIFCRNVMIYFDRETQLKVLERFVPHLSLSGLLFAGHSESLAHAAHLFRLCGKTLYQRAG